MKTYFTTLLFLFPLLVFAQFDINTPIINQGDFAITDTVYMSPDGNDGNDGTIDNPVKTFTKAMELLPFGQAGVNGGHAYGLVRLLPGVYENVGSFQQTSGKWKKGNTYKNVSVEGIGDVTIGGSSSEFMNQHVLVLKGSHIFVKNIKIRFASGIGLLISNSEQPKNNPQNNVLIENVTIDSVSSFSILMVGVKNILVNNAISEYAGRPDNEHLNTGCSWPSGIKFLECDNASIFNSRIAYTRGEGLNFQNTKYGQAYDNILHDNSGANFYNDNSSRLTVHHNYVYNNPELGETFWRICPAAEGKTMSSSAFLLANEGSCGEGYIASYENCSLKCSNPIDGDKYISHVDSVYIYDNIIQNCGRAFSFWDGSTTKNLLQGNDVNCIRNVFIFNNTIVGLLGDPDIVNSSLVNFAFPDYNAITKRGYAIMSNVRINKNIFIYDKETYSRSKAVTFSKNDYHPGPLDFRFNENIWNQSHTFLGANDKVIDSLNTDIPSLKNSLSPIDPCDHPDLTFKTEKEFDFLVNDYIYNERIGAQTNVGAIEKRAECDLTTSVQYNSKNLISIFPNPCKSCSKITINTPDNLQNVRFRIYDYSGQLKRVGTLNNNELNVNGLSQGIYFLHLESLENSNQISNFLILE
ncbi:MAG: right-handed parallel beta-helix repeat-containing protein [Chitinophagales bacterium]|nr:right-handed parallel beta-helix repeat-containing protein [Chitinophagales bacterium]